MVTTSGRIPDLKRGASLHQSMFRKIASLLTDKSAGRREACLGLLVARELEECAEVIMGVFQVNRHVHDSEDTWEWLEGEGAEGVRVNVSRPHDGDSGMRGLPVVIRIAGPSEMVSKQACAGWAQRLADVLKTEVWIGDVVSEESDASEYTFDVEERFNPVSRA